MFAKILVGLDGSDGSKRALEQALALARLTGASVHALSVEEHLPAYAATVGEMQDEQRYKNQYFHQVQAEAEHAAVAAGVSLTHEVAAGHAAQLLVARARELRSDLIVLGHTGHSRLHNLFLGSTADRAVEHAPCAVLIVR